MVALIFVSAFGTLALSFWPYLIRSSSRSTKLPRRRSSLMFHVLGRRSRLSPDALYTLISYSVFRGKIRTTTVHY